MYINHLDLIIMEIANVSLETVVLVLTGIYEVLSRVIPTNKTWSIIGNILKVLTFISNIFDRKKEPTIK